MGVFIACKREQKPASLRSAPQPLHNAGWLLAKGLNSWDARIRFALFVLPERYDTDTVDMPFCFRHLI
jgi:hypothetical protein